MDTKKLRQKILDLAIHGKLVPQDPNDEPASVLLERIRAEKEQLIKEGKIKAPKKTKTTGDTSHYGKEGPWELPEGWVWTTLGTVCHIAGRIGFRGYTKADLVKENGAITLSPSNIIDGKMNFSHYTMISWEKYNESPEIQVNVGDILLVKTGSSYGKAALVDILPLQSTINPQFVVLKHILCDSYFLIHLLQSGYAKKLYDAFVLGTAIPTFTQAALNEMLIPLPPLSEQRRIVTAINKWNNHISQVDKAEHDLQIIVDTCKAKVLDLATHGKLVSQDPSDEPAIELLRRIKPDFTPSHNLHYMDSLPNGWCFSTIGDIFQHNTGKALNGIDHEGVMLRYITTSNLYWDRFDLSEERTMPFTEKEQEKCRAQKGDLLVCEGGDIGRAAIWPYEESIMIQNHIHRLRPKAPFSVRFFYYIFYLYKQKGLIGGKGIGIQGLSSRELDKMVIPVPPVNEQHRIVTAVEEKFAVLDTIADCC